MNEQERAFALAEARNGDASATDAPDETDASTTPNVNMFFAGIVFLIAAINDTLDYFVIGSIPIIGDLLDGFTWGMIALWVMMENLERPPFALTAGAIEFIPLGDLIPTYTLQVLWIVAYNKKIKLPHAL